MTPEPAFLTVKQAAERLCLSETAVYALCEAGELSSVRVGLNRGRIRIEPASLAAYVDKGRKSPPVQPARPQRRSSTRDLGTAATSVLAARGWDGRSRVTS